MSEERRDHLKLCNEHNVPFQDFERQFCSRCLQPECTRSRAGESKFEHRVHNWQDRLFDNVPTMPNDDPRLVSIRAKKFMAIDPGRVPEVGQGSAWLDPRDLPQEPEVSAEPVPASVEEPVDPVLQEEAAVAEEVDSEPSEDQVSDPQNPPANPLPRFLMNTPTQSGQMVGGREAPKAAPPRDPWAPKEEPQTGDVEVVKPGARIRFDGSGV